MICIYDLETFPNFFSAVYMDKETGKFFTFYYWNNDTSQHENHMNFLRDVSGLIGFNNLSFDYPILHDLILGRIRTTKEIYEKAQNVINQEYSQVPKKYVRIPQLDLYKIAHLDNVARRTSLKWIEFFLRMEKIEDLPFDHTYTVKEENIETILDYNKLDVKATYRFYKICKPKIKLRKKFGKRYGLDLTNYSDSKIGSEVLLELYTRKVYNKQYDKFNSEVFYELRKEIRNKRTKRNLIRFSDILLNIQFNSNEFRALYNFLQTVEIRTTKNALNDIYTQSLGDLYNYIAKSEFDYKEKRLKSLINKNRLQKLNVVYKGFQYDYGTGGLHGSIAPGVYRSSDRKIIVDQDVGFRNWLN